MAAKPVKTTSDSQIVGGLCYDMLDGYIYAVGGWEGTERLDSVERYNPQNNTWSFVAPLKMAVTSPAVVAHDGMLYVTGKNVLT